MSRTERYRKRCGDEGNTIIDETNPMPKLIDPITLEPVVTPAISPFGHVMGLATWKVGILTIGLILECHFGILSHTCHLLCNRGFSTNIALLPLHCHDLVTVYVAGKVVSFACLEVNIHRVAEFGRLLQVQHLR